jgi:hypothetical protein
LPIFDIKKDIHAVCGRLFLAIFTRNDVPAYMIQGHRPEISILKRRIRDSKRYLGGNTDQGGELIAK